MKTSKTTMTSSAFISPFKILKKPISLPKGRWLLIHDQKIKNLSKLAAGTTRIAIAGGEAAKSFSSFEKLLNKVVSLEKGVPFEGICVVGGGSLGDAGAFLASVYRRGVRLILVPSTYLSVIDSAFGGKTALNFAGAKNQIGSFYPAEKVLIIKELLPKNPQHIRDAFAEILKMAILERTLWQRLEKTKGPSEKVFWELAEEVIRAKLKVVKRDPHEKNGERRLLNLGHTLGHLFEKLAPISHGEAVALGLYYELEFFFYQKKFGEALYLELFEMWEKFFDFDALRLKLGKHSLKKARQILSRDKKARSRSVYTPVVYAPGKVVVEKIFLEEFLVYLQGQGVLR